LNNLVFFWFSKNQKSFTYPQDFSFYVEGDYCSAKVGTPSSPSDFRPLSVVSILSKAFERILHDQVPAHVNNRSSVVRFSIWLQAWA
jgi:hypothetical protein